MNEAKKREMESAELAWVCHQIGIAVDEIIEAMIDDENLQVSIQIKGRIKEITVMYAVGSRK